MRKKIKKLKKIDSNGARSGFSYFVTLKYSENFLFFKSVFTV